MNNVVVTALTVVFVLYLISTATFLLLDNRNPQTTVAWMLTFLFLLVIGILLYIFFGRDWKAYFKDLARFSHFSNSTPQKAKVLKPSARSKSCPDSATVSNSTCKKGT